jgi:hypothetical protein
MHAMSHVLRARTHTSHRKEVNAPAHSPLSPCARYEPGVVFLGCLLACSTTPVVSGALAACQGAEETAAEKEGARKGKHRADPTAFATIALPR